MAITVRAMDWPVKEENSRSLGFGTLNDAIQVMVTAIDSGPFICGEQFTAADVYVGSHLDFAMQFGNIEKTDALEEYITRLHERPAFQRCSQICQSQIQQSDS